VGVSNYESRYDHKDKHDRKADVWDFISNLKTEDVHIQPVSVKNTGKPQIITIGGKRITIGGKSISIGGWRYGVDFRGSKADVFSLVERESLTLFGKFIDGFNTL
jgi:hypothetical protein